MGFIPKPSEAIEGGGLLQDVDVRIVASTYDVFDFNGKGTKDPANPTGANAALRITIRPLTATDESEDEVQHYTAGWITSLAPSEDNTTPLTTVGEEGPYLIAAEGSTATGIRKNSDMMRFLQELHAAGFPEDRITDNAGFLVGLEGHLVRKPRLKKDGSASFNTKGQLNTYATFSHIHKYPWDKKSTAGAGSSKGSVKASTAKSATAAAKATAVSAEDRAKQFLAEFIPTQSQPIDPVNLKKQGFGWALAQKLDAATRNAMCALLVDENFLLANSQEADDASAYVFNSGVLTAAA